MRKFYSIVSYCERTKNYRHDFWYGDTEAEAKKNAESLFRGTYKIISIVEIKRPE